MSQEVRLQNPLDFTVEIRSPDFETIVGTGVAVSPELVITCAHVVESAIGISIKNALGKKIGICFPLAGAHKKEARHAIVDNCSTEYEDDIVSLRLIDMSAPIGPEKFAIFGSADNCLGHEFFSYGFSRTGRYPVTWAMGKILGHVQPPADKNLQKWPIQLSSQELDYGMSGSAVLDKEKNLVVGLIAERYFPSGWQKGDIAYAVDAVVLTLDPFSFKFREDPLPLRPAPKPHIDMEEIGGISIKRLEKALNNAPTSLHEWVGREELLEILNQEWSYSKTRIIGLIGFGGEGKSSLARRWIDDLLNDKSLPQPSGVFWWGFYERPIVDEFFEAAFNYLSAGKSNLLLEYPSSHAKIHFLAGMLTRGRYLFVLDGLEVLQHQEGDQYGLLMSNDLREFLEFFAAPEQNSLCLITSRVRLLDLMHYTTYKHLDVDRLSTIDGCALLRELGVNGSDEDLGKVVEEWDGHALTLSLLASFLTDHQGGNIERIKNISPPTAEEPVYSRVHRILHRYDSHLKEEERTFLMIFSAFRTPVKETAFNKVFRAKKKETKTINAPIAALDDTTFESMILRLKHYRILRYNGQAHHYTIHPLIRAYYLELLMKGARDELHECHRLIKEYYLDLAINMPKTPTLEELSPLIEAVHHACGCDEYDEANQIVWERISQRENFWLTNSLAAYETGLALMSEFFPNGDYSQEPLVSTQDDKAWILNAIGFVLVNLGDLHEAKPILERANYISLNISKNYHWASIGYKNLSALHSRLGELDKSIDAAVQARDLSFLSKNKCDERDSLARYAWANHLRGNIIEAEDAFQKAEGVEKGIKKDCLYSLRATRYADHLRRKGDRVSSRKVANLNLKVSQDHCWLASISRSYRILGELEVESGHHEIAQKYYDEALKVARNISRKDILIEALSARGRYIARYRRDFDEALGNLEQALVFATSGGYRLYEADIRTGIAWAYLITGDKEKAKLEAERSKQMSKEMSYFWGTKDAEEVLGYL